MLTASRLASYFIDENLKSREQQAVGTSEFLESQLQETKTRLEAQEERVKQYKLRYMGELPAAAAGKPADALPPSGPVEDEFRRHPDRAGPEESTWKPRSGPSRRS